MINTIVSLLASCLTIMIMRLAGKGDQRFNYLGLVNCGIWWILTVITQSWGLIFLNIMLAYTYIMNIRRWKAVKEPTIIEIPIATYLEYSNRCYRDGYKDMDNWKSWKDVKFK